MLSKSNKQLGSVIILEGHPPDFGRTATDYIQYRQGFPPEFFKRLVDKGIIKAKKFVLDIGTGTGTIARGFAQYGCEVYAIDPAESMLEKAKIASQEENLVVHYQVGTAEKTGMAAQQFDIVVAGQAWHWFNHKRAISEIIHVIKQSGRLIIAHFDWLPIKGSVAALSEFLIKKYNPRWRGDQGTGFYPAWATQLAEAGFSDIETWTFDKICIYKHDSWRGRIRASAGVGGSLSADEIEEFDQAHTKLLKENFPQLKLTVPHRCFTLVAKPPVARMVL